MAEDSEVTYESVVQWHNDNFGYAGSVAAFSRRYPWAKRAFAEAPKEHAAELMRMESLKKSLAERRMRELH